MPKPVSSKPRYAKLHELLSAAYRDAMKPEAEPAEVERVKGMISLLRAAEKDGVFSLDLSRNFHNTITEIIGLNSLRPEDQSKDQRVLDYGMQCLHKIFGGAVG